MKKATATKLMVMAGLVTADAKTSAGKAIVRKIQAKSDMEMVFEKATRDYTIMVWGGDSAKSLFATLGKGQFKVQRDGDDASLADVVADEIYESSGREIEADIEKHVVNNGLHLMLLDLDGESAIAVVENMAEFN